MISDWAAPKITLEAERLVPTQQPEMPYIWVTGEQFNQFEDAAATDSTVNQLQLQADLTGGRLYTLKWDETKTELLQ